MTRYYNENPQVTYLLAKIEAQQDEVENLKYEYGKVEKIAYKYWLRERKLTDLIEDFQSLPWYKKMFYKFRL